MSEKASAAAGWYPHPDMANTQRYWDGTAWTDQVAPAASTSRSGPGVGAITLGVVAGLVIVILLVVFVVNADNGTENLRCLQDTNAGQSCD